MAFIRRAVIEEDFGELLERFCGADIIEDNKGDLSLSAIGRLAYGVVTLAFYPKHALAWIKQRGHLELSRRRAVAPVMS